MEPSLKYRLETSDTRYKLGLPHPTTWMHRKGWETGVGMERGLAADSAKHPLLPTVVDSLVWGTQELDD